MTFRDAQHRVHMDMVKTRMFLLGLGSGTTLTLFIASILLMVASYSPTAGAISVICGWPYPLYRAAFLASLCGLLYGAVVFAWRRNAVDFRRALHLSPAVTYQAILSYSYACFVIVFACFVLFALLLLAPAVPGARNSATRCPPIAFMAPFLVAAWPRTARPACAWRRRAPRARRALALELWDRARAPFSKVTFAHVRRRRAVSMPKIFADAQYGFAIVFDCDTDSATYIHAGYAARVSALCRALNRRCGRRLMMPRTDEELLECRQIFSADRARGRVDARNTACLVRARAHVDAVQFLLGRAHGWGLPRQHKRFPAWFYPSAVASNFVLGWAGRLCSPDQKVVAQHVILLLGVAGFPGSRGRAARRKRGPEDGAAPPLRGRPGGGAPPPFKFKFYIHRHTQSLRARRSGPPGSRPPLDVEVSHVVSEERFDAALLGKRFQKPVRVPGR